MSLACEFASFDLFQSVMRYITDAYSLQLPPNGMRMWCSPLGTLSCARLSASHHGVVRRRGRAVDGIPQPVSLVAAVAAGRRLAGRHRHLVEIDWAQLSVFAARS